MLSKRRIAPIAQFSQALGLERLFPRSDFGHERASLSRSDSIEESSETIPNDRNLGERRKIDYGWEISERTAKTPPAPPSEASPLYRPRGGIGVQRVSIKSIRRPAVLSLPTQPQEERTLPKGTDTDTLPIDRELDYSKAWMPLNLHSLIRVQSVRGSFELPPYFVEALCPYFSTDILFTLRDMLLGDEEDAKSKLDGTMELLLQTVLAVTWIKLACADDNEIWELLVIKAERWVKKIIGNNRVEKKLYECAEGQWVGSVSGGR